jgi:hypothetical protein
MGFTMPSRRIGQIITIKTKQHYSGLSAGSVDLPKNTPKTNWILHKHLNKHRNNEQMWNLCLYVYLFINMKPARPWMLAQLKIIWQFHAHPVHQKVSRFLGRDILGTTFFRAESSLIQSSCRSFIGVIVPYEISKVNFRVETKISI